MRRTTLFTKRPVPGAVKTRLTPPLAPSEAAELFEAMLRDVAQRCLACEEFETALRYAPAEADAWFRAAFPRIEDQAPQRGAGLAERMARHFEEALATPGTELVVGTDLPLLAPSTLVAAHRALEAGADLVLGLDGGGGYSLVGLSRPCPELFLEVEMSTPQMAQRTLALARRLGLEVARVTETRDVDTGEDLRRLARELEGLAPSDPIYPERTAALLPSLLP